MQKKILSFELPEDSFYKLTKIKSTNGHQPYITEGQSITGDLYSNPVKLDERCTVARGFSNSISTSFVKEIALDKSNNRKLIITTENSVYELEEIDES